MHPYICIFINLDIYTPRYNSKLQLVAEIEPVVKTEKKKKNMKTIKIFLKLLRVSYYMLEIQYERLRLCDIYG